MQSNYRKLGDYIRLVDERNRNLVVKNLTGLTINKVFIPSVANTVGTDMSTYKIIRQNQFACSTMQVRRDKKMPVALWKEDEPAIISAAYPVFEIMDEQQLFPEYLMMWFSRSEFDREACFLAVGGVRGSLEWEDFLNMEFPLPTLEKQKELVAEYQTVEQRIQLNNQLCEKLEETAQTIYRHWFEDFEFPVQRHCEERGTSDEAISMVAEPQSTYPVTERSRSYKSSGGAMVYNEELGKEIPEGWRVGKLGEVISVCYGKAYDKLSKGEIPMYGSGGIMSFVNKSLYDKETVLIPRKGSLNNIMFLNEPFWSVDTMFYSKPIIENSIPFVFQFLRKHNFSNSDQGSAVPSMTTSFLNDMQILIPDSISLEEFRKVYIKFSKIIFEKKKQTQKLEELKSLLLGKMAVES